jgi:hypothetical protein
MLWRSKSVQWRLVGKQNNQTLPLAVERLKLQGVRATYLKSNVYMYVPVLWKTRWMVMECS